VKRNKTKSEGLVRSKRKTILFNTLENQALEKYLKKYNVENQSKFMREAIMRTVLKKFSDDYPTLWDQPGVAPQLRLF
jgi:hypothetical protein